VVVVSPSNVGWRCRRATVCGPSQFPARRRWFRRRARARARRRAGGRADAPQAAGVAGAAPRVGALRSVLGKNGGGGWYTNGGQPLHPDRKHLARTAVAAPWSWHYARARRQRGNEGRRGVRRAGHGRSRTAALLSDTRGSVMVLSRAQPRSARAAGGGR